MRQLWELLKKSTLIQGSIALAVVITACYLWIAGRDVPNALLIIVSSTISFYFGVKIQQELR